MSIDISKLLEEIGTAIDTTVALVEDIDRLLYEADTHVSCECPFFDRLTQVVRELQEDLQRTEVRRMRWFNQWKRVLKERDALKTENTRLSIAAQEVPVDEVEGHFREIEKERDSLKKKLEQHRKVLFDAANFCFHKAPDGIPYNIELARELEQALEALDGE